MEPASPVIGFRIKNTKFISGIMLIVLNPRHLAGGGCYVGIMNGVKDDSIKNMHFIPSSLSIFFISSNGFILFELRKHPP